MVEMSFSFSSVKLNFSGVVTPYYILGTIIIIRPLNCMSFAVSILCSHTLTLKTTLKISLIDLYLKGEENKVQKFSQDQLVVYQCRKIGI